MSTTREALRELSQIVRELDLDPMKTIRLRCRVDVQVSLLANDAVAEAVAELRRTLEREGYSPEIDYCGDVL